MASASFNVYLSCAIETDWSSAMSFWPEIRPPTQEATHDPNDHPSTTSWVRKAVVHLPLAVALIAAFLGLAVIADQQMSSDPPLIIESADLPTASAANLIDLNTATVAELATLPGIGETRARAIIALREQARFASLADLADRGILRPSQLIAIAEQATVYVTYD